MVDSKDVQTASELQFFGKMTASISHEIKNVMAIINESAGLLEDYTLMAEKGMPIKPDRLKTVSDRVTAQIGRANTITRNLNSLAHSVDEFQKSIGIKETLDLALGLCGRFADMRGVKLDFQPPADFPTVITSPFHFLNLIWQILDSAMDAADRDKTIHLSCETGPDSVSIEFKGMATLTDKPLGSGESALLRVLNAEINYNETNGKIILTLPKSLCVNR